MFDSLSLSLFQRRISNQLSHFSQVKSRRSSLLMSSGNVQCPESSSLKCMLEQFPQDESVLSSFAEIADMKGARLVKCVFDNRRFGVESLLETKYATCQGESLIMYTDAALSPSDIMKVLMVNELQGLDVSKPFRDRLTFRNTKGGRPFRGPGLCNAFLIGDCVQILTGGQLLFVEPFSSDEDGNNGQCRAYSFVGTNMIHKFKDQFEVFTSLPFVDDLKGELHGTIVRIAFRRGCVEEKAEEMDDEAKEDQKIEKKPWTRTYADKDKGRLGEAFEDTVRDTLLFTTSLTRIVLSHWNEDSKLPTIISRCTIKNMSPELQKKRAKVSHSTAWQSPSKGITGWLTSLTQNEEISNGYKFRQFDLFLHHFHHTSSKSREELWVVRIFSCSL